MNARTAKARAHAAENRPILIDEVNRGLVGLGSALVVDLSAEGQLTLTDRFTGEVLIDETASFELLGKGTLTQGVGPRLQNMLTNDPAALEARLIATITHGLPRSVYLRPTARDAAKVISAVIRPLWLLASDPAVSVQALLAAKASPGVRLAASRLLGAAGAVGGDGARFGAQGFEAAPVLASLSANPSAVGRALGRGGSVRQLVRRVGAGPNVASLRAGVVSRVTSRNVDWLEEALAGLKGVGVAIPSHTSNQRQLVDALLSLETLAVTNPPAGFIPWYARHRAHRIALGFKTEIVSDANMALWACITEGESGGWHLKINFEKATASAYEFLFSEHDLDAPPDQTLKQKFASLKTEAGWLVRPAESAAEIYSWGRSLNVCLQQPRVLAHTVSGVLKGSTLIVGVFRPGAKLVSVAELTADGLVVQHRARANGNPPPTAFQALAAALTLNSKVK